MNNLFDPPRVRLDFPDSRGERTPLSFTDPVEVIVATELGEVRAALRAVERAAARGFYAVGYLSYEAAPAFDTLRAVHAGGRLPLVWFGVYRAPSRGPDLQAALTDPGVVDGPEVDGPEVGGGVSGRIGGIAGVGDGINSGVGSGISAATSSPPLANWQPDTPRAAYDAAIGALQEDFAAGDVAQVNYTVRLRARLAEDDLALYRRLLAAQGPAYGAYLDLGFARILSASPELFFRRTGNQLSARPMKGTARRGRWPAEDDAAAAALAGSAKDRAENLLTVDWLRAELERLAHPGTVAVSGTCAVERYPTVLQLTTALTAELPAETSLETIFAELFPAVSVAGVPRDAAMRRIADLEAAPREVYCGAIGMVEPGGDCVFNVPIRTIWIDTATGVAEYGVGGGITAASTAVGEYDEVLAKSAVLTRPAPDFELLETLRLADGRYSRVERHLARLGESARYFGWPDPVAAARVALAEHAALWPRAGRRVRLLVDARGGVRVESEAFRLAGAGVVGKPESVGGTESAAGAESLAGTALLEGAESGGGDIAYAATDIEPGRRWVGLARTPVSRAEPFLQHKTTYRMIHDSRRAEYPDLFDVLLYNEQGELTEFSRGNLVVELDGIRWTPPRECGLLAGAFRAELLEQGQIRERVLRETDLPRATGIWLINSLREWVPVRYRPSPH